jgi:hypothetical protein
VGGEVRREGRHPLVHAAARPDAGRRGPAEDGHLQVGLDVPHDGCPLTEAHVEATHKEPRPGGTEDNPRYVLTKPEPDGRKIDAAVTSILCHEAAGDVTAAGLWPKPRVRREVIAMR